jgi:hypothetical protein
MSVTLQNVTAVKTSTQYTKTLRVLGKITIVDVWYVYERISCIVAEDQPCRNRRFVG